VWYALVEGKRQTGNPSQGANVVGNMILWTCEMGLAAVAWLVSPKATAAPAATNRRPWND
jgi:hypothetical protein